jgi:hypothetical protein
VAAARSARSAADDEWIAHREALLPGLGDHHRPVRPLQERRTELTLQGLDGQAQQRLGQPQPRGGAAEMQFLGDCNEGAACRTSNMRLSYFTVRRRSR